MYSDVNRHLVAKRAFSAVTGSIDKLDKTAVNKLSKLVNEMLGEFNALTKYNVTILKSYFKTAKKKIHQHECAHIQS